MGGEDGPTHHGVFGLSYLRMIPGMTVLAPRCVEELQAMLAWALAHNGPVAIRYPRAEHPNSRPTPANRLCRGNGKCWPRAKTWRCWQAGSMVAEALNLPRFCWRTKASRLR
jgi:deoxyxylulose-5-phosphate synthase